MRLWTIAPILLVCTAGCSSTNTPERSGAGDLDAGADAVEQPDQQVAPDARDSYPDGITVDADEPDASAPDAPADASALDSPAETATPDAAAIEAATSDAPQEPSTPSQLQWNVAHQSCSGGLACAGDDCCASLALPAGAFPMGRSTSGGDAFASGGPDEVPERTATLSSFQLDAFEVTVGRFRKFVQVFDGSAPTEGAGADPYASGTGWQSAWNSNLPASGQALASALKCSDTLQTWSDQPAGREDKPINCVTWYEAFAFCVWDGGRLPTEEEWEYAAAGAAQNRLYPWGQQAPDPSITSYGCDTGACTVANIDPVGSKPGGDARWGHHDLGGNLTEWNVDWYKWDWYTAEPTDCNDCACLHPPIEAFRSARGGSFDHYADRLRSAARDRGTPELRFTDLGFRCAR